ncbi:MAG: hypothetical protein ACT4P2_06925 [Pseudomonadota bacterium]
MPPLSLQHAFADRIADIRARIAQQERMATESEALVASLMDRAFTGDGL